MADGFRAILDRQLDGEANVEDVNAYLDFIFGNLPDRWDEQQGKQLVEKLAAIGEEGLPTLIQRLPLEPRLFHAFVRPVLRQLATEEHLPELKRALRRDPRLFSFFRQRRWETEALGALKEAAKDRFRPLPPEGIALIAQEKDPATYEDLGWHFVHSDFGHDRVVTALEVCPGFDLRRGIELAWKRARLGLGLKRDLALAAAGEGLPDALAACLDNLDQQMGEPNRTELLKALARLTGYEGELTHLEPWLAAHLGRLRYDPTARRYTLRF
jgi:hypothetical protein